MNKQQLIEHIMGLAEQWAEHFAWGNSADKQEAALREFLNATLSEACAQPLSDEQMDLLQEQYDCYVDGRIHDLIRGTVEEFCRLNGIKLAREDD